MKFMKCNSCDAPLDVEFRSGLSLDIVVSWLGSLSNRKECLDLLHKTLCVNCFYDVLAYPTKEIKDINFKLARHMTQLLTQEIRKKKRQKEITIYPPLSDDRKKLMLWIIQNIVCFYSLQNRDLTDCAYRWGTACNQPFKSKFTHMRKQYKLHGTFSHPAESRFLEEAFSDFANTREALFELAQDVFDGSHNKYRYSYVWQYLFVNRLIAMRQQSLVERLKSYKEYKHNVGYYGNKSKPKSFKYILERALDKYTVKPNLFFFDKERQAA